MEEILIDLFTGRIVRLSYEDTSSSCPRTMDALAFTIALARRSPPDKDILGAEFCLGDLLSLQTALLAFRFVKLMITRVI